MSLQYTIVPVTSYQQNCSIVWCDETHQAVVVDPGGDIDVILEKLSALQLEVTEIILTHGHLDHVGGAQALSDALNVTIVGPHKEDAFWLEALPQQSDMFGFPMTPSLEPQRWLDEGDTITVGNETLNVWHTPGHTPGHVILHHPESKMAFVGDVLFKGGVGRSDFPRGNHATLVASIKNKLWPLGNDVTFVPGHGPLSTFGHERKTNPFVAD